MDFGSPRTIISQRLSGVETITIVCVLSGLAMVSYQLTYLIVDSGWNLYTSLVLPQNLGPAAAGMARMVSVSWIDTPEPRSLVVTYRNHGILLSRCTLFFQFSFLRHGLEHGTSMKTHSLQLSGT